MFTSNENTPNTLNTTQVGTHQRAKGLYCATPYDTSAPFFYFDTFEEFEEKAANLRNAYGQPVEEFELQNIDSDDGELFDACNVNQATLEHFLETMEDLNDSEKAALYYLVSCNGYQLEDALDKVDEVTLFNGDEKEAATSIFDELYLADVPEAVRNYIDYDAFLNDLLCNSEIHEFNFNGETFTCTNCNGL